MHQAFGIASLKYVQGARSSTLKIHCRKSGARLRAEEIWQDTTHGRFKLRCPSFSQDFRHSIFRIPRPDALNFTVKTVLRQVFLNKIFNQQTEGVSEITRDLRHTNTPPKTRVDRLWQVYSNLACHFRFLEFFLACQRLRVQCTVFIWRCEHARVCVENHI